MDQTTVIIRRIGTSRLSVKNREYRGPIRKAHASTWAAVLADADPEGCHIDQKGCLLLARMLRMLKRRLDN